MGLEGECRTNGRSDAGVKSTTWYTLHLASDRFDPLPELLLSVLFARFFIEALACLLHRLALLAEFNVEQIIFLCRYDDDRHFICILRDSFEELLRSRLQCTWAVDVDAEPV